MSRLIKAKDTISVEALDANGNFRNFLNLETIVVSPKGERELVQLEQTGPGHYEGKFPTKQVGAYLINLLEKKNGQLQGSQVLGASVNYSPEFAATEPNQNLLRRIAEAGGRPDTRYSEPGAESIRVQPPKNISTARSVGMAPAVRDFAFPD